MKTQQLTPLLWVGLSIAYLAGCGYISPLTAINKSSESAKPSPSTQTDLTQNYVQESFSDEDSVLFHLSFEESLLSDKDESPQIASSINLTQGINGYGACFGASDTLSYEASHNILSQQGTLSVWLKPNWRPGDNKLYRILYYGLEPKNMEMHMDENSLLAIGVNSYEESVIRVAYGNGYDWKPGIWHHVVYTWSAEAVAVYVDGYLHDSVNVGYTLPEEDETSFHIGSVFGKEGFDGVIDEFTILRDPITEETVHALFEQHAGAISNEQVVEDCEHIVYK